MLTHNDIDPIVKLALTEDIGDGDITAGLVDSNEHASAKVITREAGVLCGTQFVDAVFASVDPDVKVIWQMSDGDVAEVHTPFTTRAKELRELFNGLNLGMLSTDERLDVLLHVKWTVKEFDCNLTREIVDLIDREVRRRKRLFFYIFNGAFEIFNLFILKIFSLYFRLI